MRAGVFAFAFVVLFAAAAPAQSCLHGGAESPDQAQRRREALGAARFINTLQAQQPGAAQKRYLAHEALAAASPGSPARFNLTPGESIVAGWRLVLDVTPKGYWFAITDTSDPCGFRYISNEQGIIFTAQPIR